MTASQPLPLAELSPLLDQLDEARAKGTPGPWRQDLAHPRYIEAPDQDDLAEALDPADAALIVAAVNALPQLTAAIRAVADLADDWDRNAAIFPEYGDLSAAAARSIRAAIAAPQTGQHTTDEEADRG